MQTTEQEPSGLQKAARTAALWAAMTLPAASLFLSGCAENDHQPERAEPPAATRTVDEDDGPSFGIGISGKPGIYDDSGIGINFDGELDIGIGF